jgi:Alpha-L-arabinofuranosidase B (ABFB) domain
VSDEDPAGSRLRIGRWLPSYESAPRHAVPRQVSARRDVGAPARPVPPIEPGDQPTGGGARRRFVVAGAVALSLLVLLAVAVNRSDRAVPPAGAAASNPQDRPATSPVGSPMTPSVPASASASPSAMPSLAAPGAPVRVSRTTATSPAVPVAADTPLTVGTRVGLAPVTKPGYRVRHRDFIGRIDPIGPGSVALDRADSTFTVRSGLANSRCVSFESVNYPGYFLRHQNFQIHLQPRDGTALFAADATFCPVTGLSGQHTSFRSVNYPSRYLRHRDDQLYLDPADGTAATGAAMTFAVQPGLYG